MSNSVSFSRFYDNWFEQLHHLVHQLNKAPKPPSTDEDATHLAHLVDKLMSHYAEYYRVKSVAAERDVLTVFTAPWASWLERSLHWIAGWRPTTLFHLVYTESSILFESHIVDILRGLRTGDLGDLSPTQFRQFTLTFVYLFYFVFLS
ncbi:protein DOG1-like 4 [Mercurialis annua]|uniref:protein DOG1-like 4 n=1 Tax=Mercurialis annua TaxID=3986 RepID=UPI0024ACD7EE|nr:protein DOG1-like 4 [Mercurialis annua]